MWKSVTCRSWSIAWSRACINVSARYQCAYQHYKLLFVSELPDTIGETALYSDMAVFLMALTCSAFVNVSLIRSNIINDKFSFVTHRCSTLDLYSKVIYLYFSKLISPTTMLSRTAKGECQQELCFGKKTSCLQTTEHFGSPNITSSSPVGIMRIKET